MTLALSEPHATAILLAVFGLLMGFSVLLGRTLDRVGIPIVLLFLILGMLGGSEGLGGIAFDNYEVAFRIGTIALVLILFDGGLNTSLASIRRAAAPASLLATAGVAFTAAILAFCGRLLGLGWGEAILIGAIVSSTDAAAVFAVLRGGSLRVKARVRSALEVESCINDPMAIILTFAVVETLGGGAQPGLRLFFDVPLQLLIGAAVGIATGYFARWILTHATLATSGLYPVITHACGFLAFGLATLAQGSGILGVFAAAVVLGNGPLPYRAGLTRVHDAIAWLCQVSMFLMLGLLVYPSKLVPVAGVGLLLGLALAFVARPLAASLCLIGFRWAPKEVLYVSWVGIRGAVPIILATFPVMAQLPGSDRIFHIVFFIVVVSALVPGASILPLTRKLGLDDPEPPTPAAALEIHSLRKTNGEVHVYYVDPSVVVCGAKLADIDFPTGSAVILIVRGSDLVAARGGTTLQAGDHVYVFCRPEDEPRIGLFFGKAIDA